MHPGFGDCLIWKPDGFLWLALELRGGNGKAGHFFAHAERCQISLRLGHGLRRITAFRRKPSGETGIQPGNRQIALIAALVTGQRIHGDSDQRTPAAHGRKEGVHSQPNSSETAFLHADPFLGAQIAHHGHGQSRLRNGEGFRLICSRDDVRNAGAQPSRGDSVRMKQDHGTCPTSPSAVSPKGPGYPGQFWVPGFRAEICQGLLKGRVGAVPRVTPELAVRALRLFVGRRNQGTAMLLCQSLPVKIESASDARFAGSDSAAVLMDDDSAKLIDAFRKPGGETHGIGKLSGIHRIFVSHPVIGRFGGRKHTVGRILRSKGTQRGENRQNEDRAHDSAFGANRRESAFRVKMKPALPGPRSRFSSAAGNRENTPLQLR